MRKLKVLSGGLLCTLLGIGMTMMTSCQAEDSREGGEGKGAVQLNLTATTGFELTTRAVDEGSYLSSRPVDGYKVQILKDGTLVPGCDWTYSAIPEGLIELSNGSYEVIAFDGEEYNESATTREGIYMYGSKTFDVNSDQVAPVSVACSPACGKLVVKFGEDMATYFNDYAVHFSTKAIGSGVAIWSETDADPLYVKLDKAGETVKASFKITKKDGDAANIDALTRAMKWGDMWTISVNPKVESNTGKVGITITFDDSTNDKPIEIEIPSDWL